SFWGCLQCVRATVLLAIAGWRRATVCDSSIFFLRGSIVMKALRGAALAVALFAATTGSADVIFTEDFETTSAGGPGIGATPPALPTGLTVPGQTSNQFGYLNNGSDTLNFPNGFTLPGWWIDGPINPDAGTGSFVF